MAYSTSNPPRLLVAGMGGSPAMWHYSSTDVSTAVKATGYFSNGAALGMRVGDVLHSVALSTAGAYVSHSSGVVSSVPTSSAATVTFGNLESTA